MNQPSYDPRTRTPRTNQEAADQLRATITTTDGEPFSDEQYLELAQFVTAAADTVRGTDTGPEVRQA